MSEINSKLKKLEGNRDGLKEYLKTLDIDEITSFLDENIHLPNGTHLLKQILTGFGDGLSSQRKKCDTILFVLKLIDEKDIPDRQCQVITDKLNSHYTEMSEEFLLKVIDNCIQGIQNGKVNTRSWSDTFPIVLDVLIERTNISYNDEEMTGIQFKKQIINTLCMINWAPNILTKMAAMFRSISLTQEEHSQIVSKLCQNMEHLMTQEVPPYIFQLLKLCESHNLKYVFLQLQSYFSKRIPDLDSCKPKNMNLMDSELEIITSAADNDAYEAISTILFHIDTFVNNIFPGINEYLNFLKVIKNAPEFVLHPFQLTILLIISSNSHYNSTAFEIIRQCVSRTFHEDDKRQHSAWFEKVTPVPSKLDTIFTYLVENDLSERNLIVEGLVNFAFVLLDFKAGLGMKTLAEKHWELATLILIRLIKTKRDTAGHIVKKLCTFIMEQKVAQYIDCLFHMVRDLKLVILENQRIIINLIECLLLLPGHVGDAIINAIMPLIKISTTIRDNLILVLRKALWCGSIETRQFAVVGFLKLFKSIKVSNLAAFSQGNSISQRSILSQLTVECRSEKSGKVNNEALCLEILHILRHCLMQQAEVRIQFYDGLCEAVCSNDQLGIPVLDLLWNHFNNYYVIDEETLPPIHFSKIVSTNNVEVVLQEPIGHLIYKIGLILVKLKEVNNEENFDTIEQSEKVFESLIERMTKCELMHFELDDGTDLTDLQSIESQTRMNTLKQALSIYEALIGYTMTVWKSESKNSAKKINGLFQTYSRLIDFLKNIHRPKKEGKKNKDDSELNKTKSKSSTLGSKIQITHILDFPVIIDTLKLLYENSVSWASVTDSNNLKAKREFHRYILNIAIQLIQNLKTKIGELKYTDKYYDFCVEIATILFHRVIDRLEMVIDFDLPSCSLGVELFQYILVFITTYYKNKFVNFLKAVLLNDDETELGNLLCSFIAVYKKLVEMEENEILSDSEGKKIVVTFVNSFSLLVTNLPKDKAQGTKVLDWLENYLNDNTISNKQITNLLIQFWFNLHLKYKWSDLPLENVGIRLCDIMGAVNIDIKPSCGLELKSIDEGSVFSTLLTLASTLKTLLDEIDWLINRFKSEFTVLNLPSQDRIAQKREILRDNERILCNHTCKIIEICKVLGNIKAPNGTYTEAIIKILMHLYITLSAFTKFYILTSSKTNPAFQSTRFDLVVKLSGQQFNGIIANFILTIEQNQQENSKKRDGNIKKAKVLKETRLIPKLACEIEKYGKNIIQLSNKTKIDLNKYIGPGTSRDFRLKTTDLKAALEANRSGNDDDLTFNENNDSVENMEESDPNETHNDEEQMEVDQDEEKEDDDKENEEEAPPKKKAKK